MQRKKDPIDIFVEMSLACRCSESVLNKSTLFLREEKHLVTSLAIGEAKGRVILFEAFRYGAPATLQVIRSSRCSTQLQSSPQLHHYQSSFQLILSIFLEQVILLFELTNRRIFFMVYCASVLQNTRHYHHGSGK